MKNSHTDKSLNTHCKEVLSRLENKDRFDEIISYGHDFAKITTFFQKKLKGTLASSDRDKANHSYLSALFTYYILKNERFKEFDCILGYSMVFNHHNHIRKIEKMYPIINEGDREFEVLEIQLKDLVCKKNKDEIKSLYSEIGISVNVDDFANKVMKVTTRGFLSINKEIKASFKKIVEPNPEFLHKELLKNMPTFNKADYYSAGNIKLEETSESLSFEDVLDYINKLSKKKHPNPMVNKLNQVRLNCLKEALVEIDNIDIEKDLLLFINLFTGGGKTLLSLAVALKIKELKEKKVKSTVRIAYSIPFINIIIQIVDEFNYIMSTYVKDYDKNSSKHLLEHFYLANSIYKDSNSKIDKEDLSSQKLIIDNFESQLIITTFIQLFGSLFTNKNSNLSKMSNLRNSIVILDEVQNIQPHYWGIIENILEFWSKEYNIHFILMTATKPMILDGKSKILLDRGFSNLPKSRIKLYFERDGMTLDKFSKRFIKREREKERKSILVILNTVKSTQEFIDHIEGELTDYQIFLLETDITSKERNERLKVLKKKIKDGEKLILVSTQLIEAGVDISFDRIYRDIAGIDNIFQGAGRGDRSFDKKEMAEMYVIKLVNDRNTLYASFIYDNEIIEITEKILIEAVKVKGYIEDKYNFDDLTKRYFEEINRLNKSYLDAKAKYLWDGFLNFDSDIMNQFQLIKDENKLSIFIELDDEAKKIYDRYKIEVANEFDFKKRRNAYLKIRGEFSKYVVNVFEESKEKYLLDNYWSEIVKNSTNSKGDLIDIVSIPINIVDKVYDKTEYRGKGLLRV